MGEAGIVRRVSEVGRPAGSIARNAAPAAGRNVAPAAGRNVAPAAGWDTRTASEPGSGRLP